MKWKIILILPLLLLFFQDITAQEKENKVKIKGVVKTSGDKPVANAFIFIDGEIIDSKTRTNGKFRIKVPESSESISVYTLDNRFAEMEINSRRNLNITISDPHDSIKVVTGAKSEELIDLGYYKNQADKITSSIGVVKSKQGEENYYDNIYDMLRGELPGVSVVGNSITIRGPGSLRSSNEPLFVVDGTPVNSVSHIMPANVESVSVLKGASANMYGARGSNGVISITMKGGHKK